MAIKREVAVAASGWMPLALGFRPFFLLAAISAMVLMMISVGGFMTGIWHYNYFDLSLWHAHEMVFGFAVAVVAGFLLTAVRNWTGIATPTGWQLGLLTLLWLLPRLLSALPITPWLFAAVDLLFLPTLAWLLFANIRRGDQPHNYPVPALLLLLAGANLGIHLDRLDLMGGLTLPMLHLAVVTLVAIIVLVGGRVVPFFIGRTGGTPARSTQHIERLALPSVLLFAVINLLLPAPAVVVAAIAVALLHAYRLYGWFTRAIWRDAMLWILWLAYAWLVAGFLIYAAALQLDLMLSTALHAWTVGSISSFTLGMMARVALGHTGRPVTALPWMGAAFGLMMLAAMIRVVWPLLDTAALDISVMLAGLCWVAAFLIFTIRYAVLLVRPRIDGREG